MTQPTVNVTVIRPKRTGPEWFGRFVAGIAAYFLYGGVLAWALSQVSALPDLGYIESVFVVVAARTLFTNSSYTLWTREPK